MFVLVGGNMILEVFKDGFVFSFVLISMIGICLFLIFGLLWLLLLLRVFNILDSGLVYEVKVDVMIVIFRMWSGVWEGFNWMELELVWVVFIVYMFF